MKNSKTDERKKIIWGISSDFCEAHDGRDVEEGEGGAMQSQAPPADDSSAAQGDAGVHQDDPLDALKPACRATARSCTAIAQLRADDSRFHHQDFPIQLPLIGQTSQMAHINPYGQLTQSYGKTSTATSI